MPRAQDLIATAYRRLIAEIPAFDRLKIVVRLELRGRGDVQVFRVRCPGPEVTKEEPEDAQLELAIPRARFNELAEKGTLADWKETFERGEARAGGSSDYQKLIATVVERHEARAPFRGRR